MIKAVIFDMDGVLVDTKRFHFNAMKEVFRQEYKVNITQKDYFGMGLFGEIDAKGIAALLRKYCLKGNIEELRTKKKKVLEKMEKGHLKLFPGAKDTLREMSKKYKVALTSSEWKNIVAGILGKFRILQYFDVITGKEDVKKHKPDPEPYLMTAKKLGVKPSECVAVEDSIAGIESAKRAGMKAIAVMTSYHKDKLKKADIIVKGIAQIKPEQFRKL
jgi:HAD superfamily hydrolase (TIGR01509 family)